MDVVECEAGARCGPAVAQHSASTAACVRFVDVATMLWLQVCKHASGKRVEKVVEEACGMYLESSADKDSK